MFSFQSCNFPFINRGEYPIPSRVFQTARFLVRRWKAPMAICVLVCSLKRSSVRIQRLSTQLQSAVNLHQLKQTAISKQSQLGIRTHRQSINSITCRCRLVAGTVLWSSRYLAPAVLPLGLLGPSCLACRLSSVIYADTGFVASNNDASTANSSAVFVRVNDRGSKTTNGP